MAMAAGGASTLPDAAPGEALIRVQEGTPAEAVPQIAASADAVVVRRIAPWGLYLIRFDETRSVPDVVERLKTHPAVQYAEPNARVPVLLLPGEDLPGGSPGTGPVGAGPVVVAVIDTGVYRHPDLHIWTNPREIAGNGVDDDGNGYVDDTSGYDFLGNDNNPTTEGPGVGDHGTGVAGSVAAGAQRHAQVQIMPLRAGPGPYLSLAAIVEATLYAVHNGARIINMSFGSPFPSQILAEVIRYAVQRDVLVVAAAGNENTSRRSYPAAYQDVVAVAAVDGSGRKASFSNYGPWVDFSAPGVQVTTTAYGGGYTTTSGTSFSSPLVAGAAALVRLAYPSWTIRQVHEFLASFARRVTDGPFRNALGAGIIDQQVIAQMAEVLPLQEPQTPEALRAELEQVQRRITRLETELPVAQRALDEAVTARAQAAATWAAARQETTGRLRQFVQTWVAWLRGSRQARAARLTRELTAARDEYFKALARQREAQQRLAQARIEAQRALERRDALLAQLAAARRRADDLSRLVGPAPVAAAGRASGHQQQVHQLLRQLRAVHEALGARPLPDGLSAREVPELAFPSANPADFDRPLDR